VASRSLRAAIKVVRLWQSAEFGVERRALPEHDDIYFEPGTSNAAFTYGEWTTIVVVHGTRTMVGRPTHEQGRLDQSVTDAARILTDTYAFGRIGTSVRWDGYSRTWISSTSSTTARCRGRSTRWWRPSGCPPEYAYADKSIGGDTALPSDGPSPAEASRIAPEHVHPLGRQGGHEPILCHSRPSPTTSTQVHPSA
jgi:hypothetical protein